MDDFFYVDLPRLSWVIGLFMLAVSVYLVIDTCWGTTWQYPTREEAEREFNDDAR